MGVPGLSGGFTGVPGAFQRVHKCSSGSQGRFKAFPGASEELVCLKGVPEIFRGHIEVPGMFQGVSKFPAG